MKIKLILLFFSVLFFSCSKDNGPQPPADPSQLYEYKIAPSTTNSAITTFNSDHYVYLDTRVILKNKLLVFFPGTSSSPIFYSIILKKAAAMGYHTIGLMYPDNNDIYTYSTTSPDNTRYGLCRLETFDGIDRTPGVTVNNDNCIKTRLIKLLQYLQQQYPSQNWQQFFTGSDVNWAKCVVAGHSQGGGHAFYIAKQVSVDRAVSFSSIDWNANLSTSADWVTQAGITPVSKFYSFNHLQDELFNYNLVQLQLAAMGLQGPAVSIDAGGSPYSSSHILSSNAVPAVAVLAPHHSITCLDQYVPKNSSGDVATEFQMAWEYILGK